jgi:hypothetical protein
MNHFFINENMSPSKNLEWGIRQGYIQTLLKAGVNPKWLQMELPHMTNDMMADLIRGMRKLGVIP